MKAPVFVLTLTILFIRILCDLEFKYHSNQELQDILQVFNKTVKRPLRANVYSIGRTFDGNYLWVAEITAVKEAALKIPNVKLIGNIHGNEVVGREVLLHFLYYLRDEYHRGNTTISLLLNTTRIHILPAMNPDGFNRSRPNCETDEGRFNGKGHIDLNRSFPDLYHVNVVKPQRETNAIMEWMEQIPFILSASLHGGALVANYPYDTLRERSSNYHLEEPSSLTPDDDVFKHLSKMYANNHQKMYLGNYCSVSNTNFSGGITNGALWYSLVGSMQDYNYFRHGCMEITLEISCCKYPAAGELHQYWQENKEALAAFCIEAHRGVYGQVLDKQTQQPIGDAQVKISGRNISFNSFKGTGEFFRILLPGTYTIKVQAEGYNEQALMFQISTKQLKVELDILLTKSSILTTAHTIVSTKTTEEIQKSSGMAPNIKDSTNVNFNILCKLLPRRPSRNVECYDPEIPEVGEIVKNSARSCLYSIAFLIIIVILLFFM